MLKKEKVMCPSSRAGTGSALLGVRGDDGKVTIFPHPLSIDEKFIEEANKHGKAAQRFRFTNKCVESGCVQWNGKRCGIADRILKHLDEIETAENMPPCAIRPNCRWYLQSGKDACKICPYVITEITEEEAKNHFKAIDE